MSPRTKRFSLLFSIGLALVGITVVWPGARSVVSATDSPLPLPAAKSESMAPAQASLHNPNFDNGIWYEFHLRYDESYPVGVWIPDGNYYGDPQDWQLWFLNNTDLVDSDPHQTFVQSAPESVQFRTFNWADAHLVAGLYQSVPNATPCLIYQFQMYGASRQKEADDRLTDLKVGIEPTGWALDPDRAPAVHSWPATMVWGPSHQYIDAFGPLTVTAEAVNTQIAVFSYTDARGGNSHKIHWDSASLTEVTPERIHDPENLPAPTIYDARAETGTTTAVVSWTTANEALGQVFYRALPSGDIPPTYPNLVYLPLIIGAGSVEWLMTPVNTTLTRNHSEALTNLVPGQSYEYVVVSRGPSGDYCVTWASGVQTFTTND